MKKVLLVGGEDIHMRLGMIRELLKEPYSVAVAGSFQHQSLLDEGINIFQYDLKREVSIISDIRAMWKLRKIVRDWQPDIIHAFDTKPTYLTPIALIGYPGPKVLRTITGMGKIFSNDGIKMRILRTIHWILHRIAKLRVDHTIFQNPTDQAYFENRGLVKSGDGVLIPGSGIDVQDLIPYKNKINRTKLRMEMRLEKKTVFVMVARLVEQKGVLEYIRAARIIHQRYPDTAFLLIGPSGEDEPDGVPQSVLAAAADYVQYLGRRSNVPDLLNASDVFVLPTKYREGVPRAMLEAMALSLPVIVSDVPGCREAVIGRGCGFLVPPGNTNALAEAMSKALSADLLELGAAGFKDIKEIYALPKIMAAIINIYKTP